MTSNDLRLTSKDENDKAVSKKVKSKNNLKGGVPNDDDPFVGRDLFEQTFSCQQMAEFIETRKRILRFKTK